MRVRRRFRVAERPFSVVLDAPERRIDVVSNVPQTLTRPGGRVEAVDLNSGKVTQRSAHFRFPIGAALDARRGRLFVTDEAAGVVAVLDARTLRPTHSPLRACAVPWRPAVDSVRDRLYVPCARSNAIAAFDLRSLAPLAGSPFRTGGYPLAVTAVRPEAAAVAPASPRRTDPSR
jgi:DNA-binding beta-propeller fold protein YncE